MPDQPPTLTTIKVGQARLDELTDAAYDQWAREHDLAFHLERLATLHAAIAHGTEEHRAWLKKAIDDHFAGRPVDAPCG